MIEVERLLQGIGTTERVPPVIMWYAAELFKEIVPVPPMVSK